MRFCLVWTLIAMTALALPLSAAEPAAALDRLLDQENAGRTVKEAPLVNDLTYLRRLSVDLNGRIPTEAEIKEYLALPAGTRRTQWVEKLLKRDEFADRWTVFLGDMFRIRSGSEGGASFLALVHRAVDKGMPYDVLCRQLLAASGKAGVTPEVGFILGDGADPMAMAGVTAQVFLGIRIACAQCHNHPFDTWTRKQFYDLAAFYGKSRRVEHRIKDRRLGVSLTEATENVILWPPEDKAQGKPRSVVKASFPFTLEEDDGPSKHIARLKDLRARQEAEALASRKGNTVDDLLAEAEGKLDKTGKDDFDVAAEAKLAAKNLNVEKDIYKSSELRAELSKMVTDPRNRQFARNLVNRVWGELLGRGFVNPLDDFREDNPASHPKALDYLADEFVANGYDLRWLVRQVVVSKAYQRSHLPMTVDESLRRDSQSAFVAATVRRMISEAMYDSMVQAGHLFNIKHKPGENLVKIQTQVREEVMDKNTPTKLENKKPGKPVVMMAPATQGSGYDLERSIEVNFLDVLKKRGEAIDVEGMKAMSNEEIEAMQMQMEAKPGGKKVKYITRTIETTVDDNPRFTSSMRMASPAPVGHFLRVFGQTDRSTLDERRDHSPSMRQALMMLNGKLTNEAARVGSLEPMYPLLAGDKPDLTTAILLAYREILTREPTTEEMTEAKSILAGGASPLDGMADLRWALFNSHEFRFLP